MICEIILWTQTRIRLLSHMKIYSRVSSLRVRSKQNIKRQYVVKTIPWRWTMLFESKLRQVFFIGWNYDWFRCAQDGMRKMIPGKVQTKLCLWCQEQLNCSPVKCVEPKQIWAKFFFLFPFRWIRHSLIINTTPGPSKTMVIDKYIMLTCFCKA